MRIIGLVCLCLALLALAPLPASARMSAGLSQEHIEVRSDFRGAEILVFGALDATRRAENDIVIILQGPSRAMMLRRKARIAGLWTNYDWARFDNAPAYRAVASTRALADIAPDALRARWLGFASPSSSSRAAENATFAQAARAEMHAKNLFITEPAGVAFISPRLFRATLPLPAGAPIGDYEARIYLMERGRVLATRRLTLHVDKIGLAHDVFAFAHERPFFYGLAAVLLALAIGWAGALVFRAR